MHEAKRYTGLKVTAAIALLAIAGWLTFRSVGDRKLPSFQLPDGTTVVIKGVTYGTNHVLGSDLARLVSKLTLPAQNLARRVFGKNATTLRTGNTGGHETLRLWVETEGRAPGQEGQNSYFIAMLADSQGFVSGDNYWFDPANDGSYTLDFPAFPRREKKIVLKLFRRADDHERLEECAKVEFENPLFKDTYPLWTPEPLPATKRDGHLVVELDGFWTGSDGNLNYKSAKDGPVRTTWGTKRRDQRNYSVGSLRLTAEGRTNEEWQVSSAHLSDATGNKASSMAMSWSGQNHGFAFHPSLWPSEPAWKLELELKRKQGFTPDELVVFTDVPVPPVRGTNKLSWSTNANGCMVTLDELTSRPKLDEHGSWSSSSSSQLKLSYGPLPPGTHVDLLGIVFDTGQTNTPRGWSSSGQNRSYMFSEFPTNAKTATVRIAVHKARAAEFMVKPVLLQSNEQQEANP